MPGCMTWLDQTGFSPNPFGWMPLFKVQSAQANVVALSTPQHYSLSRHFFNFQDKIYCK